MDPISLSERMRRFAQPSEVGEPVELLRAGAAFHARGLINRAIQFNLDWVWPYWIEKQFDPADESFVPRAFSFSHTNLTHRNWTAVGLPDVPHYPIIDPRGLVTPLLDGWSVDFWIVDPSGAALLLPSKAKQCSQHFHPQSPVSVTTVVQGTGCELRSAVHAEIESGSLVCVASASISAPPGSRLTIAIRPYNPEGISFVDRIEWEDLSRTFTVNGVGRATFSRAPERIATSCYSLGDVLARLGSDDSEQSITCGTGMATAAAMFSAGESVTMRVPVAAINSSRPSAQTRGIADRGGTTRIPNPAREVRLQGSRPTQTSTALDDELASFAKLDIGVPRWRELYDQAVTTLVLHAPAEVYPGPYTYRRFWYRDAALILHALACIGGHARCRRAIDLFPKGQLSDGYFRSQEGEWDSNGEVLWILQRYCQVSGETLPDPWLSMVERAAQWIASKRMGQGSPHPGLLPAGFSAEHLGLNDYYYWDDFWGIAGLKAAVWILGSRRSSSAERFAATAAEFMDTVTRSIEASASFQTCGAMPAAPDRRMDSGAIGSLVADYPTLLFPPADKRVAATAEWLMRHSFVGGGFYQNMIHSGINAYLTLHVAQVWLRAGDPRFEGIVSRVAELASPTGQWPEAIHPRTLGGCMGDGQHVWAAAEWVMMMRNLFILEEADRLIIGRGLTKHTLGSGRASFGPASTQFGTVRVDVRREDSNTTLTIDGNWRERTPALEVRVPGYIAQKQQEGTFLLVPSSAI